MPLSGFEKALIKAIGNLSAKLVKKKALEKNIKDAVHRAFDNQSPELLALCLDGEFSRQLFVLAEGATIDAENLVRIGETVSESKGLELSRENIIKECKKIALKLTRIFEKIAPEYGKQVPALEHFRDDLVKISTSEAVRKDAATQPSQPDKPLFIVPHLQNPQLKHEDNWIRQIEEALSEKSQAVIRQGVKLTGQGGIGKTAMAVEYAYRHSGKYPGGVFWLQIDQGLAGAVGKLFMEIGVTGHEIPQWKGLKEPELVQTLLSFINRHDFKLVILDNLEENVLPEIVSQIRDAHILVTTRRQSIALPSVEMGFPETEGALDVFFSYAELDREKQSEDILNAAYDICKNVDRLPLALEILGKLSKRWPLTDLAKELPSELVRMGSPTCNKECTTVIATLNLVGKQYEHPGAYDLLNVAAYLAPDSLDTGLIASILEIDKKEVLETLVALVDYSIIKRSSSSEYSIHRLTQEATRILDKNQRFGKKSADYFCKVIKTVSDKGNYQAASFAISHIIHIASMANSTQPGTEFPSWLLLSTFGCYLQDAGLYAEAENPLTVCLERAKLSKGANPPSIATMQNNLARLYRAQGKYEDAEPLFNRALDISEKALGPNHPVVATTLNNLAELFESKGKYEDAEPLYKRALEIRKKTLGPEHPDVATTLNNLAGLYYSQGKYDEAEPLFKRALEMREEALGREHPDVATTLNNLAGLYYYQGKYNEAEPLYKRDLEISEKALGMEHPDVATTLNNIAELYRSKGDYEDAEKLYKRALAIREKVLGPEHPSIATTLSNLAGLYRAQDKYEDAEPLFKRALEISEKVLGPEHPDVATKLNNLAGLNMSQGKYEDAESLYKRALKILEKTLGPEHPESVTVRRNLKILCKKID